MIIAAAGLLYLGLFALAAAMPRHAPALLGRWNRPAIAARLPLAGWGLVALSLLPVCLAPDGGRALVAWFGLLPLLAGIVLLGLTFGAADARLGVPVAAFLAVLGWIV